MQRNELINQFENMTPKQPEGSAERAILYEEVAAHVGNTPLVPVPELLPYSIHIKEECCNPSGSHYDRAYLSTLRYLEESSLIRPGDELRDITTGSAGTSLAMLGNLLGYPVRITIPDELPEARVSAMRDFGATLVRSGPGSIRVASQFQRAEILECNQSKEYRRIKAADKTMRAIIYESLTDGSRICYVNHSENALSPRSFRAIGHEIVRDMAEPPFAIVLAMGNWTTIAGISPVVRSRWSDVKVVGYESAASNSYENFGTTMHGSEDTNVPLRFLDYSLLDTIYQVYPAERDAMNERVNMHRTVEGRIGRSSLMGLVVACAIAQTRPLAPIVTIAYDHMSRY